MTSDVRDILDTLGRYALRYVRPQMTIGLGTGRAASAFINALGHSLLAVHGIPTSKGSEDLARSLGIEVASLSDLARIDIDFDGADEVDPHLNLIKGAGGALVREKIVAASSKRFFVLVTEDKLVKKLGARGIVPVEVVPFGAPLAARQISALGLKSKLRQHEGADFVSDNGNLILDCAVKGISNPARLDRDLRSIPGVVGTGIFVGFATAALVATKSGAIRMMKPR